MAQLRNKIFKKKTSTSDFVYEAIADSDTIDMISTPPASDVSHLNVVLKNSDVVSATLFNLAKDLLFNDTLLFNRVDAGSSAFSEGVFDTPRSTLSANEEIELTNLIAARDSGWHHEDATPYTPEEQIEAENRLNLLIQRKYWCTFLINQEEINITAYPSKSHKITIGPGKFKVYEEDQKTDGIYSIENSYPGSISDPVLDPPDGVFYVNEIQNISYYRRDLVSAVFRETGKSIPTLSYEYGEETSSITPKHTIKDRKLTASLGTFPLWSILYKRTGGITRIEKIDQVFGTVGLEALVKFTQVVPYDRVDKSKAVHSSRDIVFSNSNGEALNVAYGEAKSSYLDSLEGPSAVLNNDDAILLTVPNDLDLINDSEASKTIFPFMLDALYNDYVTYDTVKFGSFQLATDINYVGPEGIELNMFTAKKYATSEHVSKLNVISYNTIGVDSVIIVNTPYTSLTKLTFTGKEWETSTAPVVGDVIVIVEGYGKGKIATIKFLELINNSTQTKITVEGIISSPPNTTSKITIFNSFSEVRAGFQLTSSFLSSLSTEERLEYETAYRHSMHTSMSRLPYTDGYAWPYTLQNQIANAIADPDLRLYDGLSNEAALTTFPFKLHLNINQWYFAKITAARKEVSQPTYGALTKVIVSTNAYALENNFPNFSSIYYKNAGLYPGVDQEGETFFMIYDLIQDGQDFIWVNTEDKGSIAKPTLYSDYRINQISDGQVPSSYVYLPPYWKCVARNLDSSLSEAYRTPPERKVNTEFLEDGITLNPEFGTRYYDSTVPGIIYVDVLTGKIMLHPNDRPNPRKISITYYTKNNVSGRLDTESIIHVYNPEDEATKRIVPLRTVLDDLQAQLGNQEAEIRQDIKFRGLNSKLNQVLGNNRCGQVLLEPDALEGNYFTKSEGTYISLDPDGIYIQEQEYPVSRKFASRLTGVDTAFTLSNFYDIIQKVTVIFPEELNSTKHVRVGFKIMQRNSGYMNLKVSLRDSSGFEVGSGTIDFNDIPDISGTWFYIEVPYATMVPLAEYTYHLYAEGTSGGTSYPTIATTNGTFATAFFKGYYKPSSGVYYNYAGENAMRILYGSPFPSGDTLTPLVPVRTALADVPGSDEGVLDYYSVDFSDNNVFLNWSYENYIGIDILRGRIKLPAGLDVNNYYIEFNAKFLHSELNTKTLKATGQNYSLEEKLTIRGLNDSPDSYYQKGNHLIKIREDEMGVDYDTHVSTDGLFTEQSDLNVPTERAVATYVQNISTMLQEKVSNTQEELNYAEAKIAELMLENSILLNRKSSSSEFLLDMCNSEDEADMLNSTAKLMDDNSWNNNWTEKDGNFFQGLVKPNEQFYMLGLVESFALEGNASATGGGVGQAIKAGIEYDSVNRCYWLMSHAGLAGIGEITKFSENMKDGMLEILARYYLPAVASTVYTGITTDGEYLYFLHNSGTTGTVYKIKINADNTLGDSYVSNALLNSLTKSGEYITLSQVALPNSTASQPNGMAVDLINYSDTEIGILMTGITGTDNVITFRKKDGTTTNLSSNLTNLTSYIGGSLNDARSITKSGNDLYIRVNDRTDGKRFIYKFNLTTDILSNKFYKSSGRFDTLRNVVGDAYSGGITIGHNGDMMEVYSTPSNGKFIARRAITNAIYAENQVVFDMSMKTFATGLTGAQITIPTACMVESNRYIWTADTSATAGSVDLFRFDTLTNTFKHVIVGSAVGFTFASVTGIIDMTYNPVTGQMYLILTNGTNYCVYQGLMSTIISNMMDGYDAGLVLQAAAITVTLTYPTSNTNALYGICYDSDADEILVLNDTTDCIDAMVLNGNTKTLSKYDLPAPLTNWMGIAYKNGKIFVNDDYATTGPHRTYVLDKAKSTTLKWFRQHIYQDPSFSMTANARKCMDFMNNDLISSDISTFKFLGIKTLEDPNVMQLHTFIDKENILLTNWVHGQTPIVKRQTDPALFTEELKYSKIDVTKQLFHGGYYAGTAALPAGANCAGLAFNVSIGGGTNKLVTLTNVCATPYALVTHINTIMDAFGSGTGTGAEAYLVLPTSGNKIGIRSKSAADIAITNASGLPMTIFGWTGQQVTYANSYTIQVVPSRKNVPDDNYMGVCYGDEGFSIFHLDKYLSGRSSTGKPRYNVSLIRTQHAKRALNNLVPDATKYFRTIRIEHDMIVVGGQASYGSNLHIDLMTGRTTILWTTNQSGKYYLGTWSERNEGKGYSAGLGNPTLYMSNDEWRFISSRTFTKDDVSDYNGENPKTFFAIGTDGGCDILVIDHASDGKKTLVKVIKHVFATGTNYGRFGNWIAPSGKFFGLEYTTSIVFMGLKPIWELSDEGGYNTSNDKLCKTICTLAGYNSDISPNSKCWKSSTGQWRHQLIIGTTNSSSGAVKILDAENGTWDVTNVYNSTQGINSVDTFEDRIFATMGDDSGNGYQYSFIMMKKDKFNLKDSIYSGPEMYTNDWGNMNGFPLQPETRPLFTLAKSTGNIGGTYSTGNKVRFSKDHNLCTVSHKFSGMMMYHFLNRDANSYVSKEVAVDSARSFLYKSLEKQTEEN